MSTASLTVADSFYDVYEIPLKLIYLDDDFNCRGDITEESIKSLAYSIETERLKTPIVVQPMSDVENPVDGYDFRAVAGHRRYKAFEYLGYKKIPSFIRIGVEARKIAIENFIENTEREDLTLMAEGRWLRSTFPKSMTFTEIGEEIGRDWQWVRTRLGVLDLPHWIQARSVTREFTVNDITAIIKSPNPVERAKAILHARKDGKTRFSRKMKTKKDTRTKVKELVGMGISHHIIRMMAWVIDDVTDEQFEESLQWIKAKSDLME